MRCMDELLIQKVDVLRCAADECRVLHDQDIAIRGNRITAVGPTGGAGVQEAAEVIPGAACSPCRG